MHTECKNCGEHLSSNYCGQCGQAADTHEINLHFFWHDIQHGIFHFDKGFLFTLKSLFTRPGHAIREFIEGKRVRHFKPVAFIFLLAGVYSLLFHYLHMQSKLAQLVDMEIAEQQLFVKTMDWISNHFALITLSAVPLSALASYLAFRKTGYNFMQFVVLSLYVSAARLVISIFFLPITSMISKSNQMSIASLTSFMGICFTIWAYIQFFNHISLERRVLGLFFMALWYLLIFLVLFSIVTGVLYFISK